MQPEKSHGVSPFSCWNCPPRYVVGFMTPIYPPVNYHRCRVFPALVDHFPNGKPCFFFFLNGFSTYISSLKGNHIYIYLHIYHKALANYGALPCTPQMWWHQPLDSKNLLTARCMACFGPFSLNITNKCTSWYPIVVELNWFITRWTKVFDKDISSQMGL